MQYVQVEIAETAVDVHYCSLLSHKQDDFLLMYLFPVKYEQWYILLKWWSNAILGHMFSS